MSDTPPLIPHLPDGRPAPHLMTEAELTSFLRLDISGTKNTTRTITYWRRRGWLIPVQITKAMVYRLEDALKLAEHLTKKPKPIVLKKPTAAFGVNRPRRKVNLDP